MDPCHFIRKVRRIRPDSGTQRGGRPARRWIGLRRGTGRFDLVDETDGLIVPVDHVAVVIIAAGRPRSRAAEEVAEVVEARVAAVDLVDRYRASGPDFAEHSPVIGRVFHRLVAIGIARAETDLVQETAVDVIGRVALELELLAAAVFEMVHRCTPEFDVGITEILLVGRVDQRRIGRSRPRCRQRSGLVRNDRRQVSREVQFLIRIGLAKDV